jgi:hypothetical protein
MTADLDSGIPVTLGLPGNWMLLDQDRLGDADTADALVADHLDGIPALEAHRDAIVDAVANAMAQASEGGVLMTAVMADVDAKGAPLLANLAVAVAPLPDDVQAGAAAAAAASENGDGPAAAPAPSGGVPTVEDLQQALAEQPTDNTIEQQLVSTVLLPGGPAVRLAEVVELPLSVEGPTIRMLSVRYLFLLPGGEQLVVLSFSTPTVAAHLELQDLFNQIAASFAMA